MQSIYSPLALPWSFIMSHTDTTDFTLSLQKNATASHSSANLECYSKHSCSLISSSRAELGSLSVSSVLSVCAASSNGLSLFIALWAKVQVQHIIKKMEMRSYSLLTKSHPHPFYLNSKHENLPTGCLLGLCY